MLLCWNNRGDYHSASDILGIGEVNTIAFIIPMGFQSSATSGAKLCEAQRSKSPAQNRQREGYSDTAQRQPRTQPNTPSHRPLTKSKALRHTLSEGPITAVKEKIVVKTAVESGTLVVPDTLSGVSVNC